jgi:hypothetical protein
VCASVRSGRQPLQKEINVRIVRRRDHRDQPSQRTGRCVDVYAYEVGDDNADGIIAEDESGWSCVDDGNKICGPGNPQGVPAGQHDQGRELLPGRW